MMEALRQYVTVLTAAAILCAILTGLLGKKGLSAGIMRLLCGLVMMLCVFRFDWSGKWSDFLDVTDTIRREGELAAASGELESRNAIAASIKAQTEAYILDKAAELGASVQAEVSVNADLRPDGAVLTGNVSPYVKSRLSALLETQLGIAKEALVWQN